MKRLTASLLAASALALGACEMTSNDRASVNDVALRHPVVVSSQTMRMPLFIAGGALPSVDEDRLTLFVDEFLRAGGGVLEVAVPQAVGRDTAVAQASIVRAAAMRRGVRAYEVQMRLTDDPAGAPLVVSYERFFAQLPTCGNFSHDTASDSRNLPHSDFGCAYQSNIAAMVASPRDLVRQRAEQPSDGVRRSEVLARYRGGRNTETELGPVASRKESRNNKALAGF